MTATVAALQPKRSAERSELARRIIELAAAESDLNFTQQSVTTAQHRKWDAQRRLDEIKEQAAKAGDSDLAQLMIEAARAGKDVGVESLGAASEEMAKRIKTATQEAELFGRAQIELELKLSAKASAIEQCRFRLEEAARQAVRASGMTTRGLNDLEILTNELIKRRAVLRFMLLKGLIDKADESRVASVLRMDIPGHPGDPAYVDWDKHEGAVAWQGGAYCANG